MKCSNNQIVLLTPYIIISLETQLVALLWEATQLGFCFESPKHLKLMLFLWSFTIVIILDALHHQCCGAVCTVCSSLRSRELFRYMFNPNASKALMYIKYNIFCLDQQWANVTANTSTNLALKWQPYYLRGLSKNTHTK